MRCIIAGSRDVIDYHIVEKAIQASGWTDEITVVVSGRARGVDRFGEYWARVNGVPVDPYPVTSEEWETYGKGAGHRRNAIMAENADALIAVWDGKSRGTRNMIELASRKGLRVFVYRTDQQEETDKEDPLQPT